MRLGPQHVAKRIRDELAEEETVLSHVERDWRKFVHPDPRKNKGACRKAPRVSAEIDTSLKDFAQFLDRVSDPGQ